jgi:predicted PolB exonuclease-like 3'-5' exonuclease
MTFLAVDRARDQGAEPPAIVRFFDFVENHNPTTSNLNTAIFLIISLVLAGLTIETFARRRSQI